MCLVSSSTFLCEQMFHSWYEKNIFQISCWTDTNNDSNENTNVTSDINKVSTNKRCQFLENIVPIHETSEQNSKGYCNVDFVFTLDQTNASFICGIKVFLFPCGAATQRGSWPPHSWGFWITHNDAPQSVGLLWTSNQLVAETSAWQHTTLITDKYPCPPGEIRTHDLSRRAAK
jgi:hypothetical protein